VRRGPKKGSRLLFPNSGKTNCGGARRQEVAILRPRETVLIGGPASAILPYKGNHRGCNQRGAETCVAGKESKPSAMHQKKKRRLMGKSWVRKRKKRGRGKTSAWPRGRGGEKDNQKIAREQSKRSVPQKNQHKRGGVAGPLTKGREET